VGAWAILTVHVFLFVFGGLSFTARFLWQVAWQLVDGANNGERRREFLRCCEVQRYVMHNSVSDPFAVEQPDTVVAAMLAGGRWRMLRGGRSSCGRG
jgi:hypothetical protein